MPGPAQLEVCRLKVVKANEAEVRQALRRQGYPDEGKPALGRVPTKPTEELGPEAAPERAGPTTMHSRCLERIK